MTRAKRPTLALIISLLLLASVGVAIWQLSPQHLLIEAAVLLALTVSLWLALGWIVGGRKWATLTVLFLLVTLFLNRLGILSWITFGLWLAVIGLISLIN